MTAELDTATPFGARKATGSKRLRWWAADHPALAASLRRRLRKRLAHGAPGPFDVDFEGMKLRLYPAENQCDRIIFGRRTLPERAEHEALRPHLTPGMTFVDVGANVGSYSCFVGANAPSAHILAFEPHPRTRAKLTYNLAANGLDAQVFPVALGDEAGSMELWSDGGSNIGHTSLLKAGTSNPKVSHTVEVAVLPDVLVQQAVERVDVLKIDIEGYEDRALMPLLNAEERLWPRVVLLETAHRHLWASDVTAELASRGYRESFATSENVLLVRR